MTRVIPSKFTLPGGLKQLRVERSKPMVNPPCWMIWLNANGDFSLGTFIQLCDNGDVNRVTWHPDGSESVFNLKGTPN